MAKGTETSATGGAKRVAAKGSLCNVTLSSLAIIISVKATFISCFLDLINVSWTYYVPVAVLGKATLKKGTWFWPVERIGAGSLGVAELIYSNGRKKDLRAVRSKHRPRGKQKCSRSKEKGTMKEI